MVWRLSVGKLLDMLGGGNGLFQPGADHGDRPAGSILVLMPGNVPTTDIYLRTRLIGMQEHAAHVDFATNTDSADIHYNLGIVHYCNARFYRTSQSHVCRF